MSTNEIHSLNYVVGVRENVIYIYIYKKPDAADGKEWVTITQFSE